MEQSFKTISLAPRSIRYKLAVAFALMSVIPMLICGYLIIYYIFPIVKNPLDISLIFVFAIFLMITGFCLAKKIVYPIIKITAHARGIAEGRLGEEVSVKAEDEIGELSGSLNRLSTRLKENMTELHSYGEKIKQINMEINKKVFALSGLLQIGNLMTTSAGLDEVFNLIVEKLSQLQDGGVAFLMFLDEASGELPLRAQANVETEQISGVKIRIGQESLGKIFSSARPLVIDRQNRPGVIDENLKKILQRKNMAILPVTSSGKVIGILGTGNNAQDFFFVDDEIELIGVFAKQAAVAVENDILQRKTKELAVRDELTRLYNESYIRGRLDEEIKRAISYQRPCSFVIFEVDNFERYRSVSGEIAAEGALKKIAQTLKESATAIDKAARFADHQFALLLPEKNKQQSLNVAENIRKEVERYNLRQNKLKTSLPLALSAGISAAPVDGTTAVELINKALYCAQKPKGKKGA